MPLAVLELPPTFVASMPGEHSHIYIMSADGGAPKKVTDGKSNVTSPPNWSNDGTSLFFGTRVGSGASATFAIYRLDLKTNQLTMLRGSEGKWFARLSPDNRYLAALSIATGHLMLLDMKAQKWTELTQTPASYPSWSHDGNYVYFCSIVENESAFYRVHIKGHKQERVVSLKDVKRPTSESFGSWTGLAPDDAPLALRDISTYEIYALDWQLP